MDATAAVGLRQPMGFAYSCCTLSRSKDLKKGFASVMVRRKKSVSPILSSGFSDQGHLKYYSSGSGSSSGMSVISGKQDKIAKEKGLKMKKKKKQLKLLKGLYKDLSTFSQMDFGLESNGDLVDQVKGGMISEAAEKLLEHLHKLRAEQKELKKKMKEEKARLKAAHKRNSLANCEMSSGSSSSESSDSECEQVLDVNTLRHSQSNRNDLREVLEETTSSYLTPVIPTVTPSQPNISEAKPVPVVPTNTVTEEKMSLQLTSSCSRMGNLAGEMIVPSCSKKIEICMGGKCKRSGAGALLEEFQRVVGVEGAVSGCKCMGKCRDGPNVKVVNGVADDSVRVAANSLCLGVGLEDVNMIVANFLGENQDQLGFAAAS